MAMKLMNLKYLTAVIALVLSPSLLVGKDNGDKAIQKQLNNELKKSYLIIRNFYSGNDLKFDSDGMILSKESPGIWTLNGYFQPDKIKLSKDKIVLEGTRIYWTYNFAALKPVMYGAPLVTAISIKRTPERNNYSLIMELLGKVFLSSKEPLENFVPDYWKQLVRDKFEIKNGSNFAMGALSKPVEEVQPADESPRVIQKVTPPYTEEARRIFLSGIVVLQGIVHEDGTLKITQILRPLGAGLEESAVKNCELWKFTPGLKNGKPVPTLVHIEVSFQLNRSL